MQFLGCKTGMDTDLYKQMVESKCVLKGHFILSSGLHADTYLQCAMLFTNPVIAKNICRALTNSILQDKHYESLDYIVSPAIGGVLLGYEICSQFCHLGYKVQNFFCEKTNDEFVAKRFNFDIKGKKIAILEDVVTTGGSCLKLAKSLEAQGAEVTGIFCLVDRRKIQDSDRNTLGTYPFKSMLCIDIPVFAKDKLPEHLANSEPVYLGSSKKKEHMQATSNSFNS